MIVGAVCLLASCVSTNGLADGPTFPVEPELFLDTFRGAEGIAFSGEGRLYVAADRAVWHVETTGEVTRIAELDSNLGLAGIGERDVLAADFGPTNVFRDGPNDDGVVWRITPGGRRSVAATGIADPNFILVRADGSFLVSDDGTDAIYLVDATGTTRVWTRAIPYPNGMVLSLDGSVLYVAQIFSAINPVRFENQVWAVPIESGFRPGEAEVAARVGVGGADGLAMDVQGRVYVADNQGGSIWRFDPESGETTLIAEGMDNVASLVFGEGDFDPLSLYVTTTFRGGGKIWKIPVGVRGAPVVR